MAEQAEGRNSYKKVEGGDTDRRCGAQRTISSGGVRTSENDDVEPPECIAEGLRRRAEYA